MKTCKNCRVCYANKCKPISECVSTLLVKTGVPNAIEKIWFRGRSGNYTTIKKTADANGICTIDVQADLTNGYFGRYVPFFEVGIKDDNDPNRKIEYMGEWYDVIEFKSVACVQKPVWEATTEKLNY